jgi:hypothetical protein
VRDSGSDRDNSYSGKLDIELVQTADVFRTIAISKIKISCPEVE